MEENIKVKVLRSLGTAQGVLNPGAVLYLDERTANDWEVNGLVEVLQRPEPPKDPEGNQEDGKQPESVEGALENKESNEALETAVETPETKKPAPRNTKAKK